MRAPPRPPDRRYGPDRSGLSVYLGACLAAASEDLPDVPGTVLRDRFVGWLPRGRRAH
ncbi:hypothetical protein [Micromonospora sp. NPDC048830]|uniref:hypothetical protein n=1 Tax=Micromonospora sp. NPDC048830 TaxID=3364257 RepID=UPI00371E6229